MEAAEGGGGHVEQPRRPRAGPRADDRSVPVPARLALQRGSNRTIQRACPGVVGALARVAQHERVGSARPPVHASRTEDVVERRGRKRTRDGPGGQVARADEDGAVLVAIFSRAEPDHPIVDERPSGGHGELLSIERGLLTEPPIVGGRQTLPGAITQEERGRAAQLIAARLGHDVDRRRRGSSGFRREAVGGDLELLHRLLRDVLKRAADDVVVVVRAVHHHVAASPELTRGGDRDRVRLGRIEVRRGGVSGHEQGQLEEVASVERQRLDELRGDHGVDDRTARVDRDNADRTANNDRLAHPLEGQLNDKRRGLAYFDEHALSPCLSEARGRDGDIHGRGRDVEHDEGAIRARRRAPRQWRAARHDLDDGRCDGGASLIPYEATNGTCRGLATGLDCQTDRKRDTHGDTTDTNHVSTPGGRSSRPVF